MIRVMSANLANGGADPDAFADLVRASGADVVAVQEVAPQQAEALMSVLPHGKVEPALDHHGMGIALRRPGRASLVPLSHRGACAAELHPGDWPGLREPVEVLNVHIAAPHLMLPPRGLLLRRRQFRDLAAFLASSRDRVRCLIGDFNATPLWPVYREIASHFTDAAVTVAQTRGGRPARTWGPWPGAPRLFRIDHAFVRGLSASEFSVLPIRGSDHSAVIVDISS